MYRTTTRQARVIRVGNNLPKLIHYHFVDVCTGTFLEVLSWQKSYLLGGLFVALKQYVRFIYSFSLSSRACDMELSWKVTPAWCISIAAARV